MTRRKAYRSKWLLPDPWTVLENGYVLVSGSTIEAVGTGRPPGDAPVIDLGPGAMMPPLVNAHTHLELSALKDALPLDMGFRHWTVELIQKRAEISEGELIGAAKMAVTHLVESGCAAVADISTLGITRELLLESPLGGVFFREYLGSTLPENMQVEKSEHLSFSLAAHAPHTTSPALLQAIKQATSSADLPMSVHLAESEEELLFIQSARGDWADFLSGRGIDFSDWSLPTDSPVQHLHRLNLLGSKSLAVHLLYCPVEDMEVLRSSNTSVCFCPRSNFLLHGKLPDIPGFLSRGFKPCLGTDSLASCPSLNILDEMKFVSDHYASVSPADILAMGTAYGAAALGFENRFGRLAPGFAAPPLYIGIDTGSSRDLPMAIVSSGNTGIAPDHLKSDHLKSDTEKPDTEKSDTEKSDTEKSDHGKS